LALKMTLRTDYYADAERFEIQGEEGIIQVTRCSDRMLDEPVLTLYRDGEVRAFHNLDADWGRSFALSTRHFLDLLAGREPEEALTAKEGRRVIVLYDLFQLSNAEDLFQLSNAERRAWQDSGGSDRGLRSLSKLVGAGVGIALPMGTPGNTLRVVIRPFQHCVSDWSHVAGAVMQKSSSTPRRMLETARAPAQNRHRNRSDVQRAPQAASAVTALY
jgi:hypothetical protein